MKHFVEKLKVSKLLEKFPRNLWNLKVLYLIQNRPPFASIVSQINPVHILPSLVFKFLWCVLEDEKITGVARVPFILSNARVHVSSNGLIYTVRVRPHAWPWVRLSMYVTKHAILNYRYAPHNDVSVNDGPYIRLWSHMIMIL